MFPRMQCAFHWTTVYIRRLSLADILMNNPRAAIDRPVGIFLGPNVNWSRRPPSYRKAPDYRTDGARALVFCLFTPPVEASIQVWDAALPIVHPFVSEATNHLTHQKQPHRLIEFDSAANARMGADPLPSLISGGTHVHPRVAPTNVIKKNNGPRDEKINHSSKVPDVSVARMGGIVKEKVYLADGFGNLRKDDSDVAEDAGNHFSVVALEHGRTQRIYRFRCLNGCQRPAGYICLERSKYEKSRHPVRRSELKGLSRSHETQGIEENSALLAKR